MVRTRNALCSLANGMFRELSRENEPYCSLNFARGDGGFLVVRRKFCIIGKYEPSMTGIKTK